MSQPIFYGLGFGALVMLLRNIDTKCGLCNMARLQITHIANHVLEVKVITGDRVGEKVLIFKVVIIPSDPKIPFKMGRRQFLFFCSFCYDYQPDSRSIAKECWDFLANTVFSHGQIYVVLSD